MNHVLRWTRTVYTVADLADPFVFAADGNPSCTAFHAVVNGNCHLDMSDGSPIALKAGHFVLLPRGGKADLVSTPGARQTGMNAPRIEKVRDNLFLMRNGEGGDRTVIVSCAVQFEHPAAQRLVQLMAPVIHFEASHSEYADCISRTLKLISTLAGDLRHGDDILMMHLADALLNKMIHTSILRSPKVQSGWLAKIEDRQIGIAVGLMHDAPERDWTLVSLATEAGMSRSIFAERFAEVAGEPPMRYLSRLRMNLALTMLTGGGENIAKIAHRVGYASEAAFSRAFRRFMGVPPSAVRRSPAQAAQRAAEPSSSD